MKDLALLDGDLYFLDHELVFIEESEALTKQLQVFCNIRAIRKNGRPEIVEAGELDFDQQQGIDFGYILNPQTTENQIANHYKRKILNFYKNYIKKIVSFNVEKDKFNRELKIDFTYISIWNNEPQNFKIGLEV